MATIAQALRMALHKGEAELGVTDIFGEDVGPPLGGVFTCTQGLKNTWNTPLDERGIIGTAMGLALAGQRVVAEIQFVDYIYNTIDLLKLAGNSCWSSMGQFPLPMVVMSPVGSGIHGSLYHSHSFDALATHLPGWKVVLPSTPSDVYGLMISAIKDPNPVLFLYPKALIRAPSKERLPGEPEDPKVLSKLIDAPLGEARKGWEPSWPAIEPFEIPIGVAKVLKPGQQLTVATYGRMAPICQAAAERLEGEGISAEVIDLRSLYPYDEAALIQSVKKTRRFIVVNEDTEVTNFGEHLLRKITEACFYDLEAPPRLLAGLNSPGIGLAWPLEEAQVPQERHVEAELRALAALSA
ncbi:MAG: alpha-ketoacid dehydrogenase subunit beta [Deltaproteobacteria bacterium]|jgi:2-oxoisovalerate dehydrogenase E1 component beta subunit|nr:alpha-ketoacid dehydrogenase subunit beta [Deltaproteobacteria bacterium]